MLTRDNVINKKFTMQKRGYDVTEVDDFLDSFIDTIDSYTRDLAEARGKLAYFRDYEHTLSNSLILAQKAAEDVRGKALSERDELVARTQNELARRRVEFEADLQLRYEEIRTRIVEASRRLDHLENMEGQYAKQLFDSLQETHEAFSSMFATKILSREREALSDLRDEFARADGQINISNEERGSERLTIEEHPRNTQPRIDMREVYSSTPTSDDEIKAMLDDLL